MSQSDIDKIVVSNELSIKEKVKLLVPLIMIVNDIKVKSTSYSRARKLVDVEYKIKTSQARVLANKIKSQTDPDYRASETARKNAIIKLKYDTDPEYHARRNAITNGSKYLNKLRRELF
jgi:hypothetical protein